VANNKEADRLSTMRGNRAARAINRQMFIGPSKLRSPRRSLRYLVPALYTVCVGVIIQRQHYWRTIINSNYPALSILIISCVRRVALPRWGRHLVPSWE